MQDFALDLLGASQLIFQGDGDLWAIVLLSLRVSLTAVAIASICGMPLGALLAIARFPGRGFLVILTNAMMGLPPVVVGLCVYLLLSASGPLGVLQLLYTPTAMIVAQAILITPIIVALTHHALVDLNAEYSEQLRSFGIRGMSAVPTLLWDARLSLTTIVLAGFGRAIAEVGAVMIVGGNINHVSRVMTTTIALETSKGNLEVALAHGGLLIALALIVNALVSLAGSMQRSSAYA